MMSQMRDPSVLILASRATLGVAGQDTSDSEFRTVSLKGSPGRSRSRPSAGDESAQRLGIGDEVDGDHPAANHRESDDDERPNPA
jgi:hypothetical protein